jgi:hypothetical protein
MIPVKKPPCFLLTVTVLTQSNNTHLKCPYSPDPDLEGTLHTLDVVKINTFPPAASGRLSPEQKQLLRHAYSVVTHVVAFDVATEPSKRQTADNSLVGLTSPVSPSIIVIEATM